MAQARPATRRRARPPSGSEHRHVIRVQQLSSVLPQIDRILGGFVERMPQQGNRGSRKSLELDSPCESRHASDSSVLDPSAQ